MIEIDGSHGEGGGALLRQALAFSIFTGKEFKMSKIRAGRKKPGLAPQHLAGLRAAAHLSNAVYHGDWEGSTEVYFKPGEIKGGTHEFDIKTAGSATLLTQSLLLPSIFSGKKLVFKIKGGTDVSWSPPFDYFRSVFIPQMRRFCKIEVGLLKRGYYPEGGGEIKVAISKHESLRPQINLATRPKLLQVKGVSHASSSLESERVSERQADSAKLMLKEVPVNISTEYSGSSSEGSGITLWAIFGDEEVNMDNPVILGADALGKFDLKPEQVGMAAATEILQNINSEKCADNYLVDQLIPYMAIVGGKMRNVEITEHSRSNMYIAHLFVNAKFTYENQTLSCDPMQSLN